MASVAAFDISTPAPDLGQPIRQVYMVSCADIAFQIGAPSTLSFLNLSSWPVSLDVEFGGQQLVMLGSQYTEQLRSCLQLMH